MRIIPYIIIAILSINLCTAFLGFGDSEGESPTGFDWYEVAQWEIDFCKKWGGTEIAETSMSGSAEINTEEALSQAAMTIQAEKETFDQVNGTNASIYKVSYFIKPGPPGEMDFAVRAISPSGDIENIVSGPQSVQSTSGISGYNIFESDKNFTRVQIKYEGSRSGLFSVPIVNEDYENYDPAQQSSDGDIGDQSTASSGTGWDGW